jgi:hypothetical protein
MERVADCPIKGEKIGIVTGFGIEREAGRRFIAQLNRAL